jgi:uncharacterized protein
VNSLVTAIVATAYRRRRLVFTAVLLTTLLSLEGMRRLAFDSDVLSLLPRNNRVIDSFRSFVARFGSLDQLFVVFTAPDGHTIDEYSDEVDEWNEALRRAPEISRIDAGVVDSTRDFGWLADHQLLLLDGPRLDDALQRFSPDGMRIAVARRRDLLTIPSAQLTELVRQDPLGLADLMRAALGGTQIGMTLGVSADGYVTQDGRRRLVIARPRRPPFDAGFSRALDAQLQRIAATVGTTHQPGEPTDEEQRPPVKVQFAGGYRIAVETEAIVRREAISNTLGSLVLILPLLFIVFRSAWLVTFGALPSLLSAVVVLGAFGFANVKLSAAGTGAAAMLFGLGVDGVVLLYAAHRQALAHHHQESVPEAIGGPSVSMLLGMWTTAATFYGLMFVDFPSLQELGRLLGHSMIICGILTLVMVPALLPRRARRRPAAIVLMPRFAEWIVRRHRTILVLSAVATCLLGAAATRLRVNPTLERLRSVTDAARLESEMASAFGFPTDVYVVVAEGPQLEPLLEANERLAQQLSTEIPALVFQPPTRLLPSAVSQRQRLRAIEDAGLSSAVTRASLERARSANDFKPGAFDPFVARLERVLDPADRLTYEGYLGHGLRDVIGRFVVQEGNRWTLATYVFPSSAEQADKAQAIVDRVDPTQTFTGLTPVNQELSRRFVPQFIKGLVIGSTLVVLLVVMTFRSWRLSIYALLPTAIGLLWAAGGLAIAGVELDLFAVFAVVTFIGVGVDYGVHLVHRIRERGDTARGIAELAPVILVAAAITMLGYGTLLTSSYPPLRSIGLVSIASTIALAAASVLVLPALLFIRQPEEAAERQSLE